MHCTIHQYGLQICWNPPPPFVKSSPLVAKAPPTLRWLWSPAHFRAKAPPTWRSPGCSDTYLAPGRGLKIRTVWTKSGRMATIAGSLVAIVPPPLLLDEIYAPEYSLQNVPSMRSIKCWTDGLRHVPTVLVERVPVSKYVLVLLGF